ncbi:MAG: LysM peptidoglycan-binding domain-containing protein [Anaerolineales bacterium]
MQRLHDSGIALIVALLSIGLVVGALSISLVEFTPEATSPSTDYPLPSLAPLTYTSTLTPVFTPQSELQTPTGTLVTPTMTNIIMPVSCLPPSGWGYIFIQGGETLDIIAARYHISKDQLRVSNCLLSDNLVAGTVLYVPTAPTSTPVVCKQGATGWVKTYVVKPGDTLYAIATNHYISAELLRDVNCRIGNLIYAGEVLWVPYVATRTPYPILIIGIIVTPYPTDPLTETALPFTATIIPSNTPVPSTPTAVSTSTPAP